VLLDIAADLPAVSSRIITSSRTRAGLTSSNALRASSPFVGDGYWKPARLEVITNDMRVVRVVVDTRIGGWDVSAISACLK